MLHRSGRPPLLSSLFWALGIALFFITFAVVFVLFFKPFYYLDISLMGLEKSSGRSYEQIRRSYDAIIRYFALWNRAPLAIPDFAMSEHGRIHFEDCKRIFDAVQILCLGTGILSAVSYFRHRHGGNSVYLRLAGIFTILIPCALGICAALNWNRTFTLFHQLFFRNNYWLFDPAADPVIYILPDAFFLQCVVIILILVLAGGVFCLVRAGRRRRRVAAWQSRRQKTHSRKKRG